MLCRALRRKIRALGVNAVHCRRFSITQPFDVVAVRSQFPAFHSGDGIFFDGPGGTQVHESVPETMVARMVQDNANIGYEYATSVRAKNILSTARETFGSFLNCQPQEITFGANMTTLTLHLSRSLEKLISPEDNIVVTKLDHAANVGWWKKISENTGCELRFVDVNKEDCTLSLESLDKLLDSKTKLVAVGYASNAVGTINPVASIAKRAHAVGALVFVDAVHMAPHDCIDVAALDCDFLACSPYKFFGPHSGVLFGKEKLMQELSAYKLPVCADELPTDGSYQISKWETGTQSYESIHFQAIAGAEAAVRYIASLGRTYRGARWRDVGLRGQYPQLIKGFEVIKAQEMALAEHFLSGMKSLKHYKVHGRLESSGRTSTFGITHTRLRPDVLASALGSGPTPIYTTYGDFYASWLVNDTLGLRDHGGMLRIGLMHYNTGHEVDTVLAALEAADK